MVQVNIINTIGVSNRKLYTKICAFFFPKSHIFFTVHDPYVKPLWKQHQSLKICFDNCGGNINIFQLNTIRPPLGPASTSQYL